MEAMAIALIYLGFFAVPFIIVTSAECVICKFFPGFGLWIEQKIIGELHENAKK